LDVASGQALGHVDDDDRISVGLGDPGGQLDRLLGGLGSVNRDQDGPEHRRLTSVGGLVGGSLHRQAPTFKAGCSAGRGRAGEQGPPHAESARALTLQRAQRTHWINVVVEPHGSAAAQLPRVGRPNSELDASLPHSTPEIVQQFRWGSKAVAGANGLVKTHGRMGGLACPRGGAPAGWLSSVRWPQPRLKE
jgi:hypothetical protein